MKKLQKMSFVSVSKLSRNELRTIMGGYGGTTAIKCCWPGGRCAACVTDGAVVCTGGGVLTNC
jgi:natural product precursor